MRFSIIVLLSVMLLFMSAWALAGPYDEAGLDKDDPNIIAWATGYENYQPADNVDPTWQDPTKALGPATGSNTDIVCLGERDVASSDPPGEITLTFDVTIRNRAGYDLVVYENGFESGGGLFAELAYLEVSSDGETWARFPSVSLTAESPGGYGTIDPTDVFNLGGKHPNAYDASLGTPFDLDDLYGETAVIDGLIDLDDLHYVKVVDVPGGGNYFDEAEAWGYADDHAIYDAYPTSGSGGFDLEAVGVVNETDMDDDTVDDDTVDDDDVIGDDDVIDDDDDDDVADDDVDDDDTVDDDDDADWHADDDDDNDTAIDDDDDNDSSGGCA